MLKGRGWFGGGLWKPKNPHSLEHLRNLYSFLNKNQIVQENNRGPLVEALRSIAEILIWGDQNDSSVFDFFLEKNMLSFFLKILKQRCGSYVCVQLLQTLNILFENIRNETSLYYLLSNNHVNSIIVHKFDFSDEEVMAYYISFLKTLSLKLNAHTIHFFYNEHTNDFPLYTEAIKFFNHPESMVRIAVRTLTLNVYRVDDHSMLRFIRDRTAVPYFSNLVWFIGNHILELDACIRTDVDHRSRDRLAVLVAEHLDHLHYLNDIFRLNITALNHVLADHLLNRLLVPLLVYSLTPHTQQDDRPRVSKVLALFLLAQVFLIFSYSPLVHALARIILQGDEGLFSDALLQQGQVRIQRGFVAPEEPLEKSLQTCSASSRGSDDGTDSKEDGVPASLAESPEESPIHSDWQSPSADVEDVTLGNNLINSLEAWTVTAGISDLEATHVNITDEEKEQMLAVDIDSHACRDAAVKEASHSSRPFHQSVLDALDCSENDYTALFALCLLYALGHNEGINPQLLEATLGMGKGDSHRTFYNVQLLDKVLQIITLSAQYNSKVRMATLEMGLNVLKQLVGLKSSHIGTNINNSKVYFTNKNSAGSASTGDGTSVDSSGSNSCLSDQHLATLEGSREEATLMLRNFYKSEEIFLDMFEDEWRELQRKPLNVEYLLQDASILLPPAGTPLTGIDFSKRLPCGEVERARRAMSVYFLIRSMCLAITGETETQLPLTNPAACVQIGEVLDLNNSDLIGCVVITKEGQRTRRFLVIDVIQLILVEPDQRRLGWGVAKFVGFLQDLEVTSDKDDSRVLHVTIHRPSASAYAAGRPATPLLAAKFIFDDHIRCMAAKQRLTKGRTKARQRKLHQIARLLELPTHLHPCPSPPAHALSTMRQEAHRRGLNRTGGPEGRSRSATHRTKFTSGRVPGYALKREGAIPHSATDHGNLAAEGGAQQRASISRSSRSSSRPRPLSEEIPLENLQATFQCSSSTTDGQDSHPPLRRL